MKLGSLALLALWLSLATADIFKAGMSVVTGVNNPLTQEDLFKEGVLPFMFMKLDTLEVKVSQRLIVFLQFKFVSDIKVFTNLTLWMNKNTFMLNTHYRNSILMEANWQTSISKSILQKILRMWKSAFSLIPFIWKLEVLESILMQILKCKLKEKQNQAIELLWLEISEFK